MTWYLLIILAAASGAAIAGFARHRRSRRGAVELFAELAAARTSGSDKARLQRPHIDTSMCLGCGSCVFACPEEGVLGLAHGQATIVHGARCVGHGRCAEACPTEAITITLDGLDERRDIPALNEELEVVGRPGLFIAGELGGFALVRTALSQGAAVGAAVARRAGVPREADVRELLVVGLGPGGLACCLAAHEAGVDYVAVDQATEVGGTVASYPRRKLVLTQPISLPLGVELSRLSYEKEHLVETWERVVGEHGLSVRLGTRLLDVTQGDDRIWTARTSTGDIRARHVCLALGRRGTPRKLGVPGEDLPKVAYGLIDAQSFQRRRVLVVGGGDSAIEAAVGLARQPGNAVTLSYRKSAFFRLKARNAESIDRVVSSGLVDVVFDSDVESIEDSHVTLRVGGDARRIPNNDVFVFAGGVAPFGLLEDAGVSFDPADRPPVEPIADRGTGLLKALVAVFVCAVGAIAWTMSHDAYYDTPPVVRPLSSEHGWLGPRGTIGLWAGIVACALILWNLAYLVRRSRLGGWLPGSLSSWLASHVFTGFFAWMLIAVHSGMNTVNAIGGHAFLALTVVVATGAIGRYLYSWVPRAANGAESDLEDVRARVAALSGDWDRVEGEFAQRVREKVESLAAPERWTAGFFGRVRALFVSAVRLRRTRRQLRELGAREGVPAEELESLLALASKAHRLAAMANHYGDLRSVLASWRFLHRWIALLMVLLAAAHVVMAVRFGEIEWSVLFEAGWLR